MTQAQQSRNADHGGRLEPRALDRYRFQTMSADQESFDPLKPKGKLAAAFQLSSSRRFLGGLLSSPLHPTIGNSQAFQASMPPIITLPNPSRCSKLAPIELR